MEKLLQSPIMLSFVAALFYGIGGPFMKAACNNGATPCGVSLMYGMAAVIFSMNFTGPTVLFGTPKGLGLAVITGICFGIALVSTGKAMGLPGGYVSVVTVIIAAYPLVSVAIGLLAMGEAAHASIPRLLIGTVVVIAGLYLVATSTSEVPH